MLLRTHTLGSTFNKPTESLNLILKPLKYMQGKEAIVVCAMVWRSSCPCVFKMCFTGTASSHRGEEDCGQPVSRMGWRTRCARRKCNHKSSDTFRSRHGIVSTVYSPWLGQGHTGASSQPALFRRSLAQLGRAVRLIQSFVAPCCWWRSSKRKIQPKLWSDSFKSFSFLCIFSVFS